MLTEALSSRGRASGGLRGLHLLPREDGWGGRGTKAELPRQQGHRSVRPKDPAKPLPGFKTSFVSCF